MEKEKERKTGQIVQRGWVVGYWWLSKDGELFISSGDDMRKVEPEEINLARLRGYPQKTVLIK